MLSRQTPHRSVARPARFRRTLPTLVLGLGALALSVPATAPALAAPGGPATGTTKGHAGAARTPGATPAPAGTRPSAEHLTAAAKRAGLEPGNATMGWRERGTARSAVESPRAALLRYGRAVPSSTSPGWMPKGVLGIDVSSYQRNIDWSLWSEADKQFTFVKATEGTSYTNPYFKKQYKGAAKAGMTRGAYHFASPNGKAGYLQARYFVKHGGGWSPDGRTLPGVLDIEYNPYGSTCYGLSKKKMVAWISSFTREYTKLTGTDAVLYTTTDWWTRCTGNSAHFKKNPLWIARYGTKKPGTLPHGWTKASFWQYSANPIDQDVFPGKAKALTALANTRHRGAKG